MKGYTKLKSAPELGSRVVPMERMFSMLEAHGKRYVPTLRNMRHVIGKNIRDDFKYGYRLEHFMADLLLSCKEGKRVGKGDADVLFDLFNRRSGPIAAAIAVTVEVPDDVELPD